LLRNLAVNKTSGSPRRNYPPAWEPSHDGALGICDCWGDRLCGLVVRVPGYKSRGTGLIPSATKFSEKWWVWNGVLSASWVHK
jgi:hypothetical protein